MTKEIEHWDREWSERGVIDDIAMRDFFNGRQFILKFFPWWGKAIEAGCGLGRYVFYLRALGKEIVGVDFSSESIRKAMQFADVHGFTPELFRQADIEGLPFEDGTFSYYISLGVLEHFFRGPGQVLAEAHRLLAPGGMLLVTTPNKYSLTLWEGWLRRNMKRLLHHPEIRGLTGSVTFNPDGTFFQYWYSAAEIRAFISNAGFEIMEQDRIDLHFPVSERAGKSVADRWLFTRQRLLNKLENSPCRMVGANTVTVAVKPGKTMHCFCCGKLAAFEELLMRPLRIPACSGCRSAYEDILSTYQRRTPSRYSTDADPPLPLTCAYCGATFASHPLFGAFGLDKYACPTCMRRPPVLGELCALHVKQTWKPYFGGYRDSPV